MLRDTYKVTMAQEQEENVRPVNEPNGWQLVVYDVFPIHSIRASLYIISEQRWDSFFLKLSLMGAIIFLTSLWFILTMVIALGPMTQLGGSVDSIILGILSRFLIAALLFFVYLRLISPALSQITDADQVPDMSGWFKFLPSQWVFTLAGIISLLVVIVFRYAIIESVQTILPEASAIPFGYVAFGLFILIWDSLYFGALMFGFGMFCLGRTYSSSKE